MSRIPNINGAGESLGTALLPTPIDPLLSARVPDTISQVYSDISSHEPPTPRSDYPVPGRGILHHRCSLFFSSTCSVVLYDFLFRFVVLLSLYDLCFSVVPRIIPQ